MAKAIQIKGLDGIDVIKQVIFKIRFLISVILVLVLAILLLIFFSFCRINPSRMDKIVFTYKNDEIVITVN